MWKRPRRLCRTVVRFLVQQVRLGESNNQIINIFVNKLNFLFFSFLSDIYSTPRLSDTLEGLPNVQNTNTANCIGIVHNSASANMSSTPNLVLNGNCISSVSPATAGQRYRLDSLQSPAGCSPVPQHGSITSSSAASSVTSLTTPTTLDTMHVDSKARGKFLKFVF